MKIEKIPVNKITTSDRVRTDLGDLELLKSSIQKYGLISPILIDAEYNLIAGQRRLNAVIELGYNEIDAHIVDESSKIVKLDMEMQENLVRKDFTDEEELRGTEMKKKLLRRPWYSRLWQFIKKMVSSFISLFKKKKS